MTDADRARGIADAIYEEQGGVSGADDCAVAARHIAAAMRERWIAGRDAAAEKIRHALRLLHATEAPGMEVNFVRSILNDVDNLVPPGEEAPARPGESPDLIEAAFDRIVTGIGRGHTGPTKLTDAEDDAVFGALRALATKVAIQTRLEMLRASSPGEEVQRVSDTRDEQAQGPAAGERDGIRVAASADPVDASADGSTPGVAAPAVPSPPKCATCAPPSGDGEGSVAIRPCPEGRADCIVAHMRPCLDCAKEGP